jgi:REP element-mobilizing transposase RayT
MTIARRHILEAHADGLFHCTSRCVRRAYLCGYDRLTGKSYSHRRRWIEERIELLAVNFSVSVHGYAIMENHFHIVLNVDHARLAQWSDVEVARRWLSVYRGGARTDADLEKRIVVLARQPDRVAEIRSRLASLSWFMRALKEYIARRANREDLCTGHFWEGRFKSQAIVDDLGALATLVYVDLNPVRAGMARTIEQCELTSAWTRIDRLTREPSALTSAVLPVAGLDTRSPVQLRLGEYLELLRRTCVQLLARSARGSSAHRSDEHTAPLEYPERWADQIAQLGQRSRRAIGESLAIADLATRLGQRWLSGGRTGWLIGPPAPS